MREFDLLILDEAINALDGLSEQVIQETIEERRGQLTVLLIAHRLSTVQLVDHVVAMVAGRVIEQGRPHELRLCGVLFARLHALQVANVRAPSQSRGIIVSPIATCAEAAQLLQEFGS